MDIPRESQKSKRLVIRLVVGFVILTVITITTMGLSRLEPASPSIERQTLLLDIVKKEKVSLLIPTVDLDLKLLAKNKSKFEKLDCRVLISKPSIIDICQDKRKTYQFLYENDFDAPMTLSLQGVVYTTPVP